MTEASAEKLVKIGDCWFTAWRADFVVRLDGGTCLQLWNRAGQVTRLEGDRCRWLSGYRAVTKQALTFACRSMKAPRRKREVP